MNKFEKLLSGGDLRSLGKSNSVVSTVKSQDDFDDLMKYLDHSDRIIVMRTADAVEKITIHYPQYLFKHKKKILQLCKTAINKELKWHLALLLPRLNLTPKEVKSAWDLLSGWTTDKTNSRIVRVNSIQALYEFSIRDIKLKEKLNLLLTQVYKEHIPSLNARINKLKT